jgi:Restriction endonuclease
LQLYYSRSTGKGIGVLIIILFFILDYIYHKIIVLYLLVAGFFRSHETVLWLIVVSVAICCFWYFLYWLGSKKRSQRPSIQAQAEPDSNIQIETRRVQDQHPALHDSVAEYASFDFYNSQYWKDIAHEIRIRDDFTCQSCGIHGPSDGVELHVHHIKPRCLDGDERDSNLITLCKDCHISQPGHEHMT